ncbi:MAG: ABC transporter substrate-binding protein [Anaerolineae bacterium]
MFKKLMCVLFILSFILLYAPATIAVPPLQEGEGVLIYNSYMGDPLPREADTELVAMYQKANPDLVIVHSIVAHEDFKQAIRAYLTSSTPPDVLTWFAGNRARFFIDKGLIMDITDLWEEQGWDEAYPKGFKAMSSVNDRVYFLPQTWYWWAVFYRKSIFEKYNLKPPETWEEFLKVCETLKANGVAPIAIGTKYPWTAAGWFDYLNMRVNGPEFHINLMLGKEKYDDPRVKKVFEYWAELIKKGYFLENAAAYAWQEAIPFMLQEKAAMYLMGQFILDSVPDEYDADFDFFRFPIINPDVGIGEDAPTDGYFIAANAAHPVEAKKFLAFLGSTESQQFMAKKMGRITANVKVDPSIYSEFTLKGIELIKEADFVAQFYDRDTTPEMAEEGMSAFVEFWDNPDNIDDILARLEAARKEIFEAE